MSNSKDSILSHDDIKRKLKRMAYQIYESNIGESEIILAGIDRNGYIMAEMLKNILLEISSLNPRLCKVSMNKKQPLDPIKTSLNPAEYSNKSLILIDDVLSSGSTLIYGVKHFLDVPLKQFKTAVLVNRNHKKYPVKADFKGISLSTSIHEHIDVILEGDQYEAFLK